MLFEIKSVSRALQYGLYVVILLLSILEAGHAFVATTTALQSKTTDINSVSLGVGLSACDTRCTTRTIGFKGTTTGVDCSILWTSRLSKSGVSRHRMRPILHGGTACSGGDGVLADTRALEGNCSLKTNNKQGYYGHTSDKMSVTDGIKTSEQSGGSVFDWIQEFGNRRADIVGVFLSTAFLIVAMAPLNLESAAADAAIEDTRRFNGQESGLATHFTYEGSHVPLVAAGGGKNKEHLIKCERVQAPQPRSTMHRHVQPIDIRKIKLHFGGNSEKRKAHAQQFSSKSSSRIREREGSANQKPDKIFKGGPSRGSILDHSIRTPRARVTNITRNIAMKPISPIKSNERARKSEPHSGKVERCSSISSKMKAWKASTRTPQNKYVHVSPKALSDKREQRRKLQKKNSKVFRDSLPVPLLPESVNRALHGAALHVLMPPARMLFFLISMPVIILFLKGVGTTLFAIMKYGNDGYYRENPEGHEGTLEVGYGGVPKTDEDKCRGDQRLAETPGTAFSRFLGGRGGGSGNDSSDGGENKVEGSVRRAEKMTSGEPKSVQYVYTQRRGVFDKEHPSTARGGAEQGRAGGDKYSSQGVGNISDDAIAAMAMAAMTQKLDQMKLSLQDEVQMMKTELVQASDESERLMDKLHCLEEENKQLGEVVSCLGEGDARLLKAELFSLLSMPSFGERRGKGSDI